MRLTAVQPVHFPGLRDTFDNAVRMFLFHVVLSLQQGGAGVQILTFPVGPAM